ncbi:hypothetical protein SAMN02745119_00638 [Trichlorobacter thiogenes]|uniref:Uncharacterized protein n=1 Tax=Trichlorobacter thiogenes TaxID=115783 RepID=A0A1T4KPY0_9BACT|nr:hypothetical protein [Trichlorobacter thiogenes]SJZ44465.1 hypothetical protein SAMN02745119_00638 [Trichlorobacter thiogenes]
MLWKHYVFRRGDGVHDLWDQLFQDRPVRLLYIAGSGFDVRGKSVLSEFLQNISSTGRTVEKAELLLVGLEGYELNDELKKQTENNNHEMLELFKEIGEVKSVNIGSQSSDEDDLSANNALRYGTVAVLSHITDQTDIILDVSSLPRVVYLSLMTNILRKLIVDKNAPNALWANGINFQILVGEDATLDSKILSEDPSNDLVLIPGFSSALHAESVQDWPLVWFPILGENRVSHFDKVMRSLIPDSAEICPVVPHPSSDPRRGDRLLVEYRRPLFAARQTPTNNILYAHESHPFEAYRQLLLAMQRYRESLTLLGGCCLVVTPLASKLITIGSGLACFEMRPTEMTADYGVAIPCAEPKRYIASIEDLHTSKPEITVLLLTGEAYLST